MGTTAANFLPALTGQTLGSDTQRWKPYAINPDIKGIVTVAGSTSGTTIVQAAAVASGTLNLPAVASSDTLVGLNTVDTLANKTLVSPTLTNATLSNPTLTNPTMTTPTLGVAAATSMQVGATGTALVKLAKYQATLSPATVAANTTVEQVFAVTGPAVGDNVIGVSKAAAQAGLGIVGWRLGGANSIAITFANVTASPITPTAGEGYAFLVVQ